MGDIITREIISKDKWEQFLLKRTDANFLQSWYWGEFQKRMGKTIIRTGWYTNNRLAGIMLAIIEEGKGGKYLTVPGGPIIDWQDAGFFSAFAKEAKRLGEFYRCGFVRVRPQLESSEYARRIFQYEGFIKGTEYLDVELTSQLDLIGTEEELLSRMRKTTRHEIKRSKAMGVEVAVSKNPQDMEEFYKILFDTAKRQNFIPHPYHRLYEQFKIFSAYGLALLFKAKLKEHILAEALIIFYGPEAVYVHGGSTKEGRDYPGAYILQWEAIKEAKRRGKVIYNFGGVAPEDSPDDPIYKLSVFKRGFKGRDIEYLTTQDLIIDPLKYVFNTVVEKVQRQTMKTVQKIIFPHPKFPL